MGRSAAELNLVLGLVAFADGLDPRDAPTVDRQPDIVGPAAGQQGFAGEYGGHAGGLSKLYIQVSACYLAMQ